MHCNYHDCWSMHILPGTAHTSFHWLNMSLLDTGYSLHWNWSLLYCEFSHLHKIFQLWLCSNKRKNELSWVQRNSDNVLGQAVHIDLSSTLYFPGLHSSQLSRLSLEAYPAEHGSHRFPSVEYCPSGHRLQSSLELDPVILWVFPSVIHPENHTHLCQVSHTNQISNLLGQFRHAASSG